MALYKVKINSFFTNGVTDYDTSLAKRPRIETTSTTSEKGQKESDTSSLSSNANGVKNCTYNFNPQWFEEFSWLVFEKGAIFCKFCCSAGEGMAEKSQFVTGNRNFKRETITKC